MMMMGLDRFRELLDAYGGEPARWPANERAAAEALMAGNTEAARLRIRAAALDALLDKAADPASVIDADRLIASITAEPQRTAEIVTLRPARRASPATFWLKVASLAAAAMIGFLVGVTQLANFGDPTSSSSGLELADVSPW
jgi:hypothetical protein